ncbi:MAG: mechanosensitive ion channel family protein [bacterium]
MEQLLRSLPFSEMWQNIAGIVIIIVGTLIAVYLARFILYVAAQKLFSKTKTDLDDMLLLAGRKYLNLLVILLGVYFLFEYLGKIYSDILGEKFFNVVDGTLYSITVLIFTHFLVKMISTLIKWFGENIASKTETSVDDEFIPLVDRLIKVILYILGILVILDHFNVNITGLLTVLGVGSLAIALAAKDSIANMIGGFIIMIDRPFRVGDRLKLDDGTVCDVHEIGIRSSKFRTFENTLIIMPNAELMQSTIHNQTYPYSEIRVKIDVGVSYNEDLDHVKKVMLDEAAKHEHVLKNPPPEFRFLNFGDSSLDVSLRCRVSDVGKQFSTACDLREQILVRFRKENIEIPFPQRVVTWMSDDAADKDKNVNITNNPPRSATSATRNNDHPDHDCGDDGDEE